MAPKIHLLATGETIASTADESCASPTQAAESLVEAVPPLQRYADLTVEQFAQTYSSNMSLDTVADLADRVATIEASNTDWTMIVHRTDTMEEAS